MEILGTISPHVEPLSIDEAFLDVAGARELLGGSWAIGTALRRRVYVGDRSALLGREPQPPSSWRSWPPAARSPTACSWCPPPAPSTSCTRCRSPHCGASAARPKRCSCAWGCTPSATSPMRPVEMLRARHRRSRRRTPARPLLGPRPAPVTPGREEKSIGHEITFETRRHRSRRTAPRAARALGRRSAVRLRSAGVSARTVVLKLRFADFTTITRSRTLAEPTDLGRRIYEEVRALYDRRTGRSAPGPPHRRARRTAHGRRREPRALGRRRRLAGGGAGRRRGRRTLRCAAPSGPPPCWQHRPPRRRYGHGDDLTDAATTLVVE